MRVSHVVPIWLWISHCATLYYNWHWRSDSLHWIDIQNFVGVVDYTDRTSFVWHVLAECWRATDVICVIQ